MNQIIRNIVDGFELNFQIIESSLVINVTHPNKSQVFFGRITDENMPQKLTQISDNTKELFQLLSEIDSQKIAMNSKNQLVILVGIGKKLKEYSINLQKADISSEESLKKEVKYLKVQLQRKFFEANFYKQQYNYLLNFLQLKPNTQELEKFYKKSISQFLYVSQIKMQKSSSILQKSEINTTVSSISNNSSKIRSVPKIQKIELKCPQNHKLTLQKSQPYQYSCNICRNDIDQNQARYHCGFCDFDVCQKCISIPPQNRIYCSQQHGMTFGIAPSYLRRFCKNCKKPLAFCKGYTCIQCDQDLCENCC